MSVTSRQAPGSSGRRPRTRSRSSPACSSRCSASRPGRPAPGHRGPPGRSRPRRSRIRAPAGLLTTILRIARESSITSALMLPSWSRAGTRSHARGHPLPRVVDPDGRLGRAEDRAARAHGRRTRRSTSPLGRQVEVDEHVAQKDDVERARRAAATRGGCAWERHCRAQGAETSTRALTGEVPDQQRRRQATVDLELGECPARPCSSICWGGRCRGSGASAGGD